MQILERTLAVLAVMTLVLAAGCAAPYPAPATLPAEEPTPAANQTHTGQPIDLFQGEWTRNSHSENADGSHNIRMIGWMWEIGPGDREVRLETAESAGTAITRLMSQSCLELYTRGYMAASGTIEDSTVDTGTDGEMKITLRLSNLKSRGGSHITDLPEYLSVIGRGPGTQAVLMITGWMNLNREAVGFVECGYEEARAANR